MNYLTILLYIFSQMYFMSMNVDYNCGINKYYLKLFFKGAGRPVYILYTEANIFILKVIIFYMRGVYLQQKPIPPLALKRFGKQHFMNTFVHYTQRYQSG